jgi:hypothetical protein
MATATLRRTHAYPPARRRVQPHLAVWDDAQLCAICGLPQYARSNDRHITMDQLIDRLLSEGTVDPMRLAANDVDTEPVTIRPMMGAPPPTVHTVRVQLPLFSDAP